MRHVVEGPVAQPDREDRGAEGQVIGVRRDEVDVWAVAVRLRGDLEEVYGVVDHHHGTIRLVVHRIETPVPCAEVDQPARVGRQ